MILSKILKLYKISINYCKMVKIYILQQNKKCFYLIIKHCKISLLRYLYKIKMLINGWCILNNQFVYISMNKEEFV